MLGENIKQYKAQSAAKRGFGSCMWQYLLFVVILGRMIPSTFAPRGWVTLEA
jgi:hypothetical protein